MEVDKYTNNSSDTSSDESDHRPENNAGVGRSYECAFCKRGFTNAQALGGHMNIHRKDKLKAATKQNHHQEESHSRKSNYDHHEQQQHCYYYSDTRTAAVAPPYVSYQFNYSPPSNPNYQQVYHHTRYGDFMGANDLSLRVGPSIMEDEDEGRKEESDVEENEVDLELRLGHHK